MVAIIKTEVHPFSARTVEDVISEYLETMAETNTVLVDHKVDAYKNWEGVDAERNTFTFQINNITKLRAAGLDDATID